MSSLNTLLEAARFLELQEQQQNRTTVAAETLATMKPVSPTITKANVAPVIALSQSTVKTVTANSAPQTMVISSNNISPTILQTPITFSTPAPQIVKKLEQDGQVSSTTIPHISRQRILHNSFDIRNSTVSEDGSTESKRKQPPLVFRAGTREVHNKLEKHRRAHLKECFDILKKQLPTTQDEKKPSNLSILHSALRYIQTLKRKERELEHEMERLARKKIIAKQRLAVLKKDMSHYDNIDISKILPEGDSSPVASASTPPAEELREDIVNNGSSVHINENQEMSIPLLTKTSIPVVTQNLTSIKEISQPIQTTALSVLPMTYPVNQGLVLQKVALVPKGLDGLAPLVSTHFITPQQINGKVVPLTQYLVKPVVVVSTASPRPS
ncbi:max-binding protein MNT-like [Diorhabda carinulata]|uniref:max-binding protein MNT-like n=1 Tax=Diorhabda carinulata TaxID=1163345 RepID=UPI0025A224B2|nr:max-binding protein MNT-like [Diorhabda carinulata]